MVKSSKPKFKVNDYVFAKVKGYPAWPAKITRELNNKRYAVHFYGTAETANVKPEDLFIYMDHKAKFNTEKVMKKPNYLEATKQIEEAISGENDAAPISVESPIPKPSEAKPSIEVAVKAEEKTSGGKKVKKEKQTSVVVDESVAVVTIAEENKSIKTLSSEDTSSAVVTVESEEKEKQAEPSRGGAKRKVRPSKRKLEADEDQLSSPVKEEREESAIEVRPPSAKEMKLIKNEVPENVDYEEKEVIPALAPDNVVVKVYVEYGKPDSFDSKLSEAEWVEHAKGKAEELARSIERGDIDYKTLPSQQVIYFENGKENDHLRYMLKVDRHLNEEKKFCVLTYDIRASLGLQMESIDFEKCFRSLKELNKINYSMCLLLKHADCFLTIKRLRAYVGNKKNWNMNSVQEEQFNENARLVREEASVLYEKCSKFFEEVLPNQKKFWEEYVECVGKYDEICTSFTKQDRKERIEVPQELLDYYNEIKTNLPEENTNGVLATDQNLTIPTEAMDTTMNSSDNKEEDKNGPATAPAAEDELSH